MLRMAWALWLWSASLSAHAGEIIATDVSHEDNVYRVHFVGHIAAKSTAVRALLTDYAQLTRLSQTLQSSEIVEQIPGRQRIKLLFHTCVLIFCRDIAKTEDVYTEPNGDIVTFALPEESDSLRARERWHIVPEGEGTRVEYTAEMVPRFFVPPLIGPVIMKSKIRRELRASVERLERLTASHD